MVSISDIKASATTAESKTASCIIVQQEIKQGTAFIQVDHADKTYQYKLKNDITFQEGKLYHFVLSIKDGKINDVTATAPDLPEHAGYRERPGRQRLDPAAPVGRGPEPAALGSHGAHGTQLRHLRDLRLCRS